MSTKDKLIEEIRAVPIAGKTYEQYVEAVADKLFDNDYRKIYDDHARQCTCYALGCQMAESLKTEVAREVVDDFQRRIRHIFLEMCCGNDYNTLNLLEIDSAIEALYDTFSAELKKKYTEGEG